jgi:uroporphyrin-3 C-methyltransferase
MSEEPEQNPPPAVERARRSGAGLAAFALLLALLALGGVGYLYWQANLAPRSDDPRVTVLETRLGELEGRSGSAGADVAGAVRRETDRIAAELRAEIEALAALPGDSGGSAAPRDWQLAEARFLLRMANHRLLLERDPRGAAELLRAADAVLVATEDFGLHDVRARIAEEVLALESVPAADAEGLFLQIEAIKRDLDKLPLRLPELKPATPEQVPPATFLAAVRDELERLVRFREFDGAARPLLAPEEAVYLELNLRLMLERAQLAALHGQQTIYTQSVGTAAGWVDSYLDVTSPDVRRVLDGLKTLEKVDVAMPMPEISGSLRALDAVMESVP